MTTFKDKTIILIIAFIILLGFATIPYSTMYSVNNSNDSNTSNYGNNGSEGSVHSGSNVTQGNHGVVSQGVPNEQGENSSCSTTMGVEKGNEQSLYKLDSKFDKNNYSK